VNKEIRRGLSVASTVHCREELVNSELNSSLSASIDSEDAALFSSYEATMGLPVIAPISIPSLKGQAPLQWLRLVHIAGLDTNPCGGTHLASIGSSVITYATPYQK